MARSFNGTTSDNVQSASISWTNTAVTLSAWVKFVAFTNAYNTVIGPDVSASGGTGSGVFWQIHVKSTGKLAVYVGAPTAGLNVFYDGTGSNTLSTGTWYNLVATYNSSAGLTGYVNGSSDGTAAANGSLVTGASFFAVGFDPNFSGRNVNGSISDAAAWNTTLSAGEILALSAGARPYTIRPAALMIYYPLWGLSSPEPDMSGNTINGTVTGTALAFDAPIMIFTPRWPQPDTFIPPPPPVFNLMPQIVT